MRRYGDGTDGLVDLSESSEMLGKVARDRLAMRPRGGGKSDGKFDYFAQNLIFCMTSVY
jgi:hypothetical protein